jgi:hypothetical protein
VTVSETGLVTAETVTDSPLITITARETANGISGQATLYVVIPQKITVAPSPRVPYINMNTSTSHQFTATALLSAGTGTATVTATQDLTSSPTVSWTSSDTDIAGVTITGGLMTTATKTGLVEIKATFNRSPGPPIEGTADFAVVSTSLTSVTVIPADETISLATGTQFKAQGVFTEEALTTGLTTFWLWSSSNPDIATINEAGLATAVTSTSGASATITATDTISGLTGTATLHIEP